MNHDRYVCRTTGCELAEEVASATDDAQEYVCPSCERPVEIRLHPIQVVFTGVISARYNDKDRLDSHKEGHFMYGKDPVTGKQECNFVDTWSRQRELCKRYGYENPKNMPRNYMPNENGKGEANTRGLPGTEL